MAEESNETGKGNLRKILTIIILIVTIVLLSYYIYKNWSDFSQIRLVNPYLLIILIFFNILGIYFNSIVLNILMQPFGIKLRKLEAFGLSSITGFYNLIMPFRGGMAARAVYLKQKHEFPYVNFLATLSAIYVIVFFVGCIFGLISMLYIYIYYKIFNPIIFGLFLGFFLFLLGIIVFSPRMPEPKNRILKNIAKVINGWHLIRKNKKVIFIVSFNTVYLLIIGAIMTSTIYYTIGVHISFFKALFIASIGSISILVAITPGNLGIGDAIGIYSATVIGVGLTESVAANIIGRVAGIISILLVGPFFSWYLLKRKKRE